MVEPWKNMPGKGGTEGNNRAARRKAAKNQQKQRAAREQQRQHFDGDVSADEALRQRSKRAKAAKQAQRQQVKRAEQVSPRAQEVSAGVGAGVGSLSDDLTKPMRLQRFLARSGAVSSRRVAETYIVAGRVAVNGATVRELGTSVLPLGDTVTLDGQTVCLPESTVVLMLNKPLNCVTTMSDPQGRPCVADILPLDRFPGLYYVGRLDRNTTGLLLFSNDGALGHRLAHPSFHVEKRYIAQVPAGVRASTLEWLRMGVELDDGITQPAKARIVTWEEMGINDFNAGLDPSLKDTQLLEICISEGRNTIVRRMCKAVGFPCIALHRAAFGSLTLGDMELGEYRLLTEAEVEGIYRSAGLR